MTWNEFWDRLKRTTGARRPSVHVPVGLLRAQASLTERLPGAPVTRDQLTMLELGDNVVSDSSAVETFQPLFHLLNGDLADAGLPPGTLSPTARAQAWRDFGNNVQASAANRPWLPVPGSHEVAPGTGTHGLASFLTRYTLPPNGVDGLEGRWYAFRVGTVLFVCLSGDDVAYSGAGIGYSDGAQTRWLESTLAAARADASIDWIIAQVHQCACLHQWSFLCVHLVRIGPCGSTPARHDDHAIHTTEANSRSSGFEEWQTRQELAWTHSER